MAVFSSCTNFHTSVKLLYSGAGAARTTSGCRLSQMIPASSSRCATRSRSPGLSSRLSCAPLALGSDGVMTRNCLVSSVVPESNRYSRYLVIRRDFSLICCIEVSLNTDNAEHNDAKSIADGFETWKPPAPRIGLNSSQLSILGYCSMKIASGVWGWCRLTVIHLESY